MRVPAGPGEPFASGKVDCGRLGTRDVVFLVGTTGGTALRHCTIPAGKALLIPPVNAACSTAEVPEFTTEAQLRDCARGFADPIDAESLYLKVDSLRSIGQLSRRQSSTATTPW